MKAKNFLILFVAILVIVGITIGLFYLLGQEEKTHLFYANMVVTSILEIMLLCNLPFFTNGKLTTVRNTSISMQLFYFILSEAIWMLVFNVFLSDTVDTKYYYAGLLVIFLIFVALISIVGIGGNVQAEKQKEIEQSVMVRKSHLASTQMVMMEYRQALRDVDSEQKDRQGQQLKILLDKIAAIPAEKLERNATVVEDINIKLNGLKSYFQIRKESVEVDMDTLTREIENFTEYISYIKNTL